MIESECLSSSIEDSLPGCMSESQSSDGDFWNGGQTNIICYCPDLNDYFWAKVGGVGGLFRNSGEGKIGAVGLGEAKAMEDDLFKKSI